MLAAFIIRLRFWNRAGIKRLSLSLYSRRAVLYSRRQACPFIPAGPALYSRRAGAGAPGMQLPPSLRRREQNLNLNAQLLAGASASDLPATGVWVAGSLARSLWPGECHPAQSTHRHAAACKLVQSLACY